MKELLCKRKASLIIYLLACLMPVITDISRIFVMGLIFDAIELKVMQGFINVAFIALGWMGLELVLFLVSRMLRIRYMRDTILDVRLLAFEKIINASYQHFSKRSKDIYVSNLINDINNFERDFFLNIINIIYRSGLYLVSGIILAFNDWKLLVAMVAVSLLIYLVTQLFAKKTVALQEQVSTDNENFTVQTANTFNGLEILKLNNMDKKFIEKTINHINKVEKSKFGFRFFSDSQRNLAQIIGYISTISVLLYLLAKIPNGIGYGTIVLLAMFAGNMAFALPDIFPRLNVIRSSAAIFNKITVSEEEHITNHKPNNFVFNEKIEVKNLSFAYDSKQIFDHVSFTIEKGKKYIIKGPSGVGKSTLIKLLSKIYEDYQGEILVDGVELRTIKEASFSSFVSYIYQEVFLFEDSLENNISLFQNIPAAVIEDAAAKAGLKELVEKLPQHLQEPVRENGKNFSGGERQRISIARAIAKKASILFIDEGTSALNQDLGQAVEETFLQLPCTTLSISHRYYPGVSEQYDYVLEVKNKKVFTFAAKDYFKEEANYA